MSGGATGGKEGVRQGTLPPLLGTWHSLSRGEGVSPAQPGPQHPRLSELQCDSACRTTLTLHLRPQGEAGHPAVSGLSLLIHRMGTASRQLEDQRHGGSRRGESPGGVLFPTASWAIPAAQP